MYQTLTTDEAAQLLKQDEYANWTYRGRMYTVTFYKYFTAGTLKGLTVPASFPVSELPRAQWHVERLDAKRRHAAETADIFTDSRWIVADTPAPHYR